MKYDTERTKQVGREISREWTLGEAAGIHTVKCRKLLRIDGPRSAWDQVSFLLDRNSSQGRLKVCTVEYYERFGEIVS